MSKFPTYTLRLADRLLTVDRPQVMGIINATPDSFFAGSRTPGAEAIVSRVEQMMAEGVDMIDCGAYSSRPGAADVSEAEEMDRISVALRAIRSVAPDIPVSVDTFRASVARHAVACGADIINDISGGELDPAMFATVAELGVPYILMHMRGTPQTMQSLCDYSNLELEITSWLADRIHRLREMGVADIIADPGFGFSKTLEQNYRLLASLPLIGRALEVPLLVGLSRKSMLTRLLSISADEAVSATTAANMLALQGGASILRVHDVRQARQAVAIHQAFLQAQNQ
ncbi:MAG: dihydropteroate synthase [Bacteroides sp.]|nr:dihydropteroate synthase [Bacteroides sp.]